MSNTQIEAHGVVWTVEGQGFSAIHATEDFEAAAAYLEQRLNHLDKREFDGFLASVMVWQEHLETGRGVGDECKRPQWLDMFEAEAHAEVTKGWHRPDAVSISLRLVQ